MSDEEFLDRLDRDFKNGSISLKKYNEVLNWWESRKLEAEDSENAE